MADDIQELAIMLTARLDQLDAGLKEASEKIDDFSKKTDKAGEEAGMGFAEMAAKLYTVIEAFKLFNEYVLQAAADSEAMGVTLDVVIGNLGLNSEAIHTQEKAIEDLGYTTDEAAGILVKFARAHLDTKAAVDLSKVALDYADASGKSYAETLDSLGNVVLTGNARSLRQFGVSMQDVNKGIRDYAATLGKTEAQLTGTEKSQAALNVIMEKALDIQGEHAAILDTVVGKQKQLEQESKKSAEEIGGEYLTAYKLVLSVIQELYEFFEKFRGGFVDVAKSVVTGYTDMLDGFLSLSEGVVKALGKLHVLSGQYVNEDLAYLEKIKEANFDLSRDLFKQPSAAPTEGTLNIGQTSSSSDALKISKNHDNWKKSADDVEKIWDKLTNHIDEEFSNATARSFNAMLGLFGSTTADMSKIWNDLLAKMEEQLLTSGILSFISMIFTGGLGGFAAKGIGGAIGGGFDDPVNDAKAFAAGGKWFYDALNNFSAGYVDAAVSPSSASAMGAMMTSSNQSLQVTNNFPAMFQTFTPSQLRKASVFMGNTIKSNLGGVS